MLFLNEACRSVPKPCTLTHGPRRQAARTKGQTGRSKGVTIHTCTYLPIYLPICILSVMDSHSIPFRNAITNVALEVLHREPWQQMHPSCTDLFDRDDLRGRQGIQKPHPETSVPTWHKPQADTRKSSIRGYPAKVLQRSQSL